MRTSRKLTLGPAGLAVAASLWLAVGAGCTSVPPAKEAEDKPAAVSEPRLTPAEQLAVAEFILSPGDQIQITVYQHPELDKLVTIPPNGRIFFPSVGEVQAAGRSLRAVQADLTTGLAAEREVRIEAGDEIVIQVVRHDEFNLRTTVAPDGTVILPIAGPIVIAGKTPAEVNAAVNTQLVAWIVSPQTITQVTRSSVPARIGNPQVDVEVVRFTGQKVFVLGEVERPGVFVMDGETGLIEALAMAGGPTLDAEKQSIAVVRPNRAGGRPDVTLVDLGKVVDGTAETTGPTLQRGDVIYVPRTFIANVDRFFNHFYTMVRPVTETATGVWLWQNIEEGPHRGNNDSTIVIDRD